MITILFRRALFVLASPVLFLLLNTASLLAAPEDFSPGDVFVSLSNGKVQWLRADGALVKTLDTGNAGQAKGMAFDTKGNLYVTHWYSPDLITGNNAEIFNARGIFLGMFGSGYSCNPTSIVFDRSGNAYVGQADCEADILKFDNSGKLIERFRVVPESRGSYWIDLASDGCTMYYTSSGLLIKRFNVCTKQQLSDFNSIPLTEPAYAFRLLPGGSLLVAASNAILLVSPAGNVTATFDAAGENCWYALNIETSSTFLAGSYCSGSLYRFNLTTGAVLGRLHVAPDGTHIKGIAVVTPPPPPVPPAPPPPHSPFAPSAPTPPIVPQTPTAPVVGQTPPIVPVVPQTQTPPIVGQTPPIVGQTPPIVGQTPPIVPPTTPPPPPVAASCRMTGGGSVFTVNGIRVTHGFQLRAPATEKPQSLEVNWNDPKAKGPDQMRFHLTELTSATCVDNPNIDPEMPRTSYDTFIATGIGLLKGVPGATIEFVFTDAGEPGGIKPKNPTPDTVTMIVRDPSGNVALAVTGPLDQGNHQMH